MAVVVAGGATPRSFTAGNFVLATLQNGPAWEFTFSPALASTDAAYSGFRAMFATNDNGGLYLVNRRIEFYNGSGSGTLTGAGNTLTWSAGQTITVRMNLAVGTNASSIVVSGATTGNGTSAFTASGTYFTASTLGVGQFSNTNTFVFSGSISAVDDGVNQATAAAAATATASSVARAVTTGLAAAAATCTALVGGSGSDVAAAAAACTATAVAVVSSAAAAAAVATCTAAVAGGLAIDSATSSIAIFGQGAATLTAPGGTPLTGGGTIDPDGLPVVPWNPSVSGTSFYVLAARPTAAVASISDNRGNSYTLVDEQQYVPASDWETAVYEARPAVGGAGTVVTIPGVVGNEATLLVSAIRGAVVRQAHATSFSSAAITITSPSVSSTGPALFIFTWMGQGPTLGGGSANEGVPLVVNATNANAVVVNSRIVNHNNGWIQGKQWAVVVGQATTLSLTVNQGRSEGARWYATVYQQQVFTSTAATVNAAATATAASSVRTISTATAAAASTATAAVAVRSAAAATAAAVATCSDATPVAGTAATAAAAATASATAVARAVTAAVASGAATCSATAAARPTVAALAVAVATCTANASSSGVDLAAGVATCEATSVAVAVTTGLATCRAAAADATARRPARFDYTSAAGDPMPSTYCQGDLEPDILFPLTEVAAGRLGIQPIDLTGVSSVTVRIRRPDGSLVTRSQDGGTGGGVSIENALLGHVRLTWQSGDTELLGEYRAQVRLLWANGEVQTVPSATGDAFRWTVSPLV